MVVPRLCQGGIGCRKDGVRGQCWSIVAGVEGGSGITVDADGGGGN